MLTILGRHAHRGSVTLRPARAGSRDIPALDGLRAVAALGVCSYHTLGLVSNRFTLFNRDITSAWYYLQTGVHLFFVLSGFLLFLPYARALLSSSPLPSARRFYMRRALRILPAYWVCLGVLVALHLGTYLSPTGLANVAAHAVFLQDLFPAFDRSIEGPMWTLALEAQFYLILPLIALGLAAVLGPSRSAKRLAASVVGFGLLAIGLRALDAAGQHVLPDLEDAPAAVMYALLRATYGTQGKFLEVFAVGMLCAVVYVAAGEERAAASRALRVAGLALVGVAVAADVPLALLASSQHIDAPWYRTLNEPWDLAMLCGPALIGLTYGALLLGILWSAGWLRGAFELRPLRVVGQISYSFYLWHGPALWGFLPAIGSWPLVLRPLAALGISGTSYRLIERPFLRIRHRAPQVPGASPARTASAGHGRPRILAPTLISARHMARQLGRAPAWLTAARLTAARLTAARLTAARLTAARLTAAQRSLIQRARTSRGSAVGAAPTRKGRGISTPRPSALPGE